MNRLLIRITMLTFISFCANSFAQKEYVDPSIKQKRPLLDRASEGGVTKSVEAIVPATEGKITKQQQYCACINSTLLTEQAHSLWQSMYRENLITVDDFYSRRYGNEAEEKKALSKAFAIKNDLDLDEIDCQIIRLRTKKIRELNKAIEDQDDLCNFEQIKYKRY